MMDFLVTYHMEILGLAAALTVGLLTYGYVLSIGNWEGVRRIVLTLVIEAEKYLGTGTGEFKKQQVIQWMCDRYPLINIFLSKKFLSEMIDDVLRQLKETLSKTGADLDTLENNLIRNK